MGILSTTSSRDPTASSLRGVTIITLCLLLWCAIQTAQADPPFIAAYVHLSQVVETAAPEAARREAIAKSVAAAKRAGFTILMPYSASSSGKAYYPSSFHPELMYGEWDALGAYIEAARKAGIAVYPSVPVLTSGHDRPTGILAQHPDWALRDERGTPIGYISAANPHARAWVVGMLRELVALYGVDGVLLDYLRFPNRPVDLDPAGAARFLKKNEGAEYALTDRKNTPWQRFKENSLTTLVAEIRHGIPLTKLALYCWGPHVADGHYVGQRWDDWARNDYIDIINVSGYCYTDNYGDNYMQVFLDRLTKARALVKRTESEALFTFCLGVKTSHGAIKEASEIDDYLRASQETGMKGVALFTLNTLEQHLDQVVNGEYIASYAKSIK